MKQNDQKSQFNAKLLRPEKSNSGAPWAFVALPKDVSDKLSRRGRMTVKASINGHGFQAALEPDGQLSHWLKVSEALLAVTGTDIGDVAEFEIMPLAQEPEPEMPSDLSEALEACPEALAVWQDTTTIARVDWIHWITTAKQVKTRAKRINNACDMLSSGKRRVCCFDPSGYYSKAFGAPKAAD